MDIIAVSATNTKQPTSECDSSCKADMNLSRRELKLSWNWCSMRTYDRCVTTLTMCSCSPVTEARADSMIDQKFGWKYPCLISGAEDCECERTEIVRRMNKWRQDCLDVCHDRVGSTKWITADFFDLPTDDEFGWRAIEILVLYLFYSPVLLKSDQKANY